MVDSRQLRQGNVFVLFKGAGAQSQTWSVLDKQRCASSVALSYALLRLNINYEESKMLIGTRK